MKFLPIWASLCACLIMGCANLQQTLGTPDSVQYKVGLLCLLAKDKISDDAKARLHQIGTQIMAATTVHGAVVVALGQPTGDKEGDALLAAAVAFINSGPTIDYAKAVAAALLANF